MELMETEREKKLRRYQQVMTEAWKRMLKAKKDYDLALTVCDMARRDLQAFKEANQ